jgi:hypothetical protein
VDRLGLRGIGGLDVLEGIEQLWFWLLLEGTLNRLCRGILQFWVSGFGLECGWLGIVYQFFSIGVSMQLKVILKIFCLELLLTDHAVNFWLFFDKATKGFSSLEVRICLQEGSCSLRDRVVGRDGQRIFAITEEMGTGVGGLRL